MGKYEILNVRKDIAGASSYVRPSIGVVLHNSDMETGWQIGGNETMATVGNPEGGAFPMANTSAAAYIRNITHSIAAFEGNPNSNTLYNMPGEYMSSRFTLTQALDAVPQSSPSVDPTTFVEQTPNATLQTWTLANYTINVPDYGSVNAAGVVPTRTVLGGGTYNDGMTGSYKCSDGTVLADGDLVPARDKVAGDFNNDGQRNANDAAAMMDAYYATVKQSNVMLFQPGTKACIHILGDFNGDGNFDAQDVLYWCDGLAMDPVSGNLDRSQGFTNVDNAWFTKTGKYFFGPGGETPVSLTTCKAYAAGDARGDVAGAGAWKGARPHGGDGVVDINDVLYIKRNLGSWSDLDQAATIDLSCDMNGDLVVDNADTTAVIETILGSKQGDVNLDGSVDVIDLLTLVASFGMDNTSPTWYTTDCLCDFNDDGSCDVIDLLIMVENFGFSMDCP